MLKKGHFYLPGFISTLLFFVFFSCSDPCKDVKCNFGTCIEGTCDCEAGYEGVNCDREIRAKFIGIWEGPLADCLPDSLTAGLDGLDVLNGTSVVFTPSQSNVEDLVFSIPNPLAPINTPATIDGNNFTIVPAVISVDIMGFPISVVLNGNGRWLNENEIELNLTFEIPIIGGNECMVVLTRQ